MVLVAIAGASWSRSPAPERREHGVASAALAPAASVRALGLAFVAAPDAGSAAAAWAGDGALAPPRVDADTEPEATGVLARAITSALCPLAARALCTARARADCGPLPERSDDEGAVLHESCFELLEGDCADWVMRHYGAAPDRLMLDEGALAACTSALRADADSGQSVRPDPACDELGRDPADVGEACEADWYLCGRDGQCWDRVCQPLAQLGEPCVDVPCARGLFCTAGLCERPTPRGGPCDDETGCAERGDWCLEGRCAAHLPEGGACEYDGECARASRCLLGRCQRVPSTTCTLTEECGRDRTCVGPYVARCEPIPELDAPCGTMTDCEPWLACVDGRCAGYGGERDATLSRGAACNEPGVRAECGRGLVCLYGGEGYRCEAALPLGGRCEAGGCARDAMCVWRVQDGHCAPALCEATDYFAERDEE